MNDAVPLSVELLNELEARWSAFGLPLTSWLQDGLDPAEIEAATAELGFRLPEEAKVWWGWHDGVCADPGGLAIEREMAPPGFQFLPLEECVRLYALQRELAEDAAAYDNTPPRDEPSYWWRAEWFPFTRSHVGTLVAFEAFERPRTTSPIRIIAWGSEHFGTLISNSMGQMVSEWIEAFDNGRWGWNAEASHWNRVLTPRFRWDV